MVERKTDKSPITKAMFHEINRSIKASMAAKSYNANQLAGYHGTSAETVRSIKRSGTWPQYERDKHERRARQVKRSTMYMVNADMNDMHGAKGLTVLKAATEGAKTKVLTLDEYNDLMKLKKDVDRLKEWKYNVTNPDIVHTSFGLDIPGEPVKKQRFGVFRKRK